MAQTARWARAGIGFIQLREKDFEAGALVALARDVVVAIAGTGARLLVNGRPDVALAAGADGVHLTSAPGELTPGQVRSLWTSASLAAPFVMVSCHSPAEARTAAQNGADGIVFGPVFEKPLRGAPALPGLGLDQLRAACAACSPVPVYALGGVTLEDSAQCMQAGAAGVAGIRLFHSI